jgi:outer membrane protein OmpA-like peptidoglycan-associated protein
MLKPKAIVTVGLCLFAGVCIATLLARTAMIENDLTERAVNVLAVNGLDSIGVELDGRDARLTGVAVESSAERALSLVASVWGVRAVTNGIDTDAAEKARLAEEQRFAEEAKLAEAARLEAEREVAAARLAEEQRLIEEARLAEVARLEVEHKAEVARLAGQARPAHYEIPQQTRLASIGSEGGRREAPATLCSASIREFLARKTIEFDTGGAEIPESGLELLHVLSASALDCPEVQIEVIGHTDVRGMPQDNLDLSWRRAEAAVSALALQGVARDRLTATGHGSESPLASNATAEGRARNRRVEFHVKQ